MLLMRMRAESAGRGPLPAGITQSLDKLGLAPAGHALLRDNPGTHACTRLVPTWELTYLSQKHCSLEENKIRSFLL